MSELLFSYGTLQIEKVQLESFGRLLKGQLDILNEYVLVKVEITDQDVLSISEQKFHPAAVSSKNSADKIDGMVFESSESELSMADAYEVADYVRVEVALASGNLDEDQKAGSPKF